MESCWQEVEQLLRVLCPGNVRLDFECTDLHGQVALSLDELQSVFVNLFNNAIHALQGNAGEVTVSAQSVRLEQDNVAGLPEGDYMRLAMRDSGQGIDEAIQGRIFDPFFTTKPPGEGTGLGLSVIHGLIREAGGAMTFVSAAGAGTTFTIHLPCLPGEAGMDTTISAETGRGQ